MTMCEETFHSLVSEISQLRKERCQQRMSDQGKAKPPMKSALVGEAKPAIKSAVVGGDQVSQ